MEFVGLILGKLCDCVSPHASNCWEYHKNIKKNWNVLKEASGTLDALKTDIRKKLEDSVKPGVTEETNAVRDWLERVEKIIKETEGMDTKVGGVKFYARASRGKEVVEMIEKVERLYQEVPDGDLVRELPQRGTELPTTKILEDETTSQKMREKILACLLEEKVSKIGVFGMGGIGKTTALEHINNKLVLNPKFDKVIFVTVSKAPDVKSLQDKIASILKLELVKDADERSRAAELYKKLKESKRFVLILDNMWEEFSLKDVGIPEPTSENGCKLVLTTRELEVCRGMRCEATIEMELLSEEEALNLFNNSVGDKVSTNPEMKETLKQVARECARLPLAIVAVAGSLRDNDNRNDWVIALVDLRGAASSQLSKLMKSLRLSYDRLKDNNKVKHQDCLLHCALYSEDYPIERDLLIDQLIAVGIVDETMVHPMERGQAMLNHLVSVSLLIDSVDDDNAKCVKLHDSIRDMAIQIMRENPTRFLAKVGEGVKSIPVWNADVEKVSLMGNKIVKISSSIEPPNCPTLSTLFLSRNSDLESIPRNFFQQMLGLNVLDLSSTDIVELPESVSLLLNLAVLLLRWCHYLKHVPDLSKLSNMRRLDLCGTSIEEVPKGMEKLIKLTYLDLSYTKLSSLPTGILCNLTNLQYLSFEYTELAITEELVNHRSLKTLRCSFDELSHFNAYVRSLEEGRLTNFIFTTKDKIGVQFFFPTFQVGKGLSKDEKARKLALQHWLEAIDPRHRYGHNLQFYYLKWLHCESKQPFFYWLDIGEGKKVNLEICPRVKLHRQCSKYLGYGDTNSNVVVLNGCDTTVSSESADFPLSLPKNVEILQMGKCRISVRSLCELTSIDDITNLQQLRIKACGDDLMYLFYYSQAIFPILQRIERLEFIELPSLREFVGIEGEGVQPSLPNGSFSSLKYLRIWDCGNLKKLFSLKNASFPNLEEIQIRNCSQLEEIVSTSRENEIEEGGAAHHSTTVDVVSLPKLRELTLIYLPKLQSIPFVADSLKLLCIQNCPNLKRIPFLDREPWHPSLETTIIDEEIWSSLEWNYLKDKDAYRRTFE